MKSSLFAFHLIPSAYYLLPTLAWRKRQKTKALNAGDVKKYGFVRWKDNQLFTNTCLS